MAIIGVHQPIGYEITQPDLDSALRCGILFVRKFHADFDDDILWEALSFCEHPMEREMFLMAVVGELRELAGDA